MSISRGRQLDLFGRSTMPPIALDPNHRLVLMTDELEWTQLIEIVEEIRAQKLKSRAGRKPHLRALIGAVILMATRRMTYREAEDQIRHYGPARYLCGLTECNWTPDFTTIQDFVELLGDDGMRRLNEYVLVRAVEQDFADPSVAVADTTAQEAAIPYPNEVGLMSAFVTALTAGCRKGERVLRNLLHTTESDVAAFAKKVREYRLFAKTKEVKDKAVGRLSRIGARIQKRLGEALDLVEIKSSHATRKLGQLHATMGRLLPQIRSWLSTGRVAKGKVISMHCPELYSIVRGKIGKKVEFGLKWGILRVAGGYLWSRGPGTKNFNDKTHALEAVKDHVSLFGAAPRIYAYDRGGYSPDNVQKIKQAGVKHVGVAPTGRARWNLGPRIKKRVLQERCRVEGAIGALKRHRYGFNLPNARSTKMIATCGQRAILGLNLNKLVRDSAQRHKVALVG